MEHLQRDDHDPHLAAFRGHVRNVFQDQVLPNCDRWERQGVIDRQFWLKCGEANLLCPTVPKRYGGAARDFRYNAVIQEELAYVFCPTGLTIHSDIVANYLVNFGSDEQKRLWLPRMVSGEVVTAVAMTEPGAGSDLQGVRTWAKRDGDHFVINGSKTYISNGQCADLFIVVVKTNPAEGAKGISLILVEGKREGFIRGRNLDKIGQKSADTSELFFDNVRVPVSNLLGEENKGFVYLMTQLPEERISLAVSAQGSAQRARDEAVGFAKSRHAQSQAVRFLLADLKAKIQVGWAHLDWSLSRLVQNRLTPAEASAAKLWHTELQWEAVDAAMQIHGDLGLLSDHPVARLWRDARVTRIYGGSSEIMKELIARSI